MVGCKVAQEVRMMVVADPSWGCDYSLFSEEEIQITTPQTLLTGSCKRLFSTLGWFSCVPIKCTSPRST